MEAESQSGRWWMRYAGLLVVAVVVAAYSNSFAGAFHMDDGLRILRNPALRNPLAAVLGTTRPLVGLTLWLNMALGGRVADFHLFNLAVHVSAVLLLFGIIRQSCSIRGCAPGQAVGFAAVGAAIWGVHPIQTQSVTYVIQRAESMMGMFVLLTLYAFVRALTASRPRGWLVLSVAACVLGMMSKPTMLVVPLVVLLFERGVGREQGAGSGERGSVFASLAGPVRTPILEGVGRELRGYFVVLFGTMAVGIALLLLPNESSTTAGFSAGLVSPWRYLLTQCAVIVHYLKLVVWPRGLCLDYAWPPVSGFREVWWQALVMCGLVLAAVVGMWKRWVAGFGLAMFLLLLVPTSSVIPVADAAMEHRMYLPLAGLLVCLAGMYGVKQRAESRLSYAKATEGKNPRWGMGHSVRALACMCVVIVLALLTYQRNAVYHSVEAMARDTVANRPDNFRARSTLVMALLDSGKFAEGENEARELVARLEKGLAQGGVFAEVGGMNAEGYTPVGLNQLGRALLCLGRNVESIVYFDRAIEARPTHKEAWLNKAIALHESGDSAGALEAVEEALRIDPDYEKALQVREIAGGQTSE